MDVGSIYKIQERWQQNGSLLMIRGISSISMVRWKLVGLVLMDNGITYPKMAICKKAGNGLIKLGIILLSQVR